MKDCGRVGVRWFGPRGYVQPIPFRLWLFSTAHVEESYFWRVLGFEINAPRASREARLTPTYCGRCICCVIAGKKRAPVAIGEIPIATSGQFLITDNVQCCAWRSRQGV